MSTAVETTAQATIFSLHGQINSANASELEKQVLAALDGGVKHVVFDFTGLDYISSAGLRVVLVVAKRLKQDGLFVLCNMQQHVREVFDISGFLAILNVEGTREQALARFPA